MTERYWAVSVHRDGNYILIGQKSSWRHYVESAWFSACGLSRGLLHGDSGLLERIPLGRPDWCEDDLGRYLANSLSSRLFDLENKVVRWTSAKDEDLLRIPATDEQVRLLAPDFAFLLDDDDDDDDSPAEGVGDPS